MPRISAISLHAGPGIASADVIVDGVVYRDLILRLRRVSWPCDCALPPSQRKRLEPQIRRAYLQWLDLAGGFA
jgi:hypothetical protein